MPGTDPIRIAVITFALPRDNLLIAEATKLALAPLFPNRGIKLIFCTFEEFDRIVLSRGAEFILGTSGAVTRLSTFGLRPLATLVSKGGPDPNRNEGSAVIVREDHREFQTLGDLKGRTIAASNALSFPGWQIVLGEVAKFGINPNEFFGKTIFTGDARSISDIVKLVLDEKADAASCGSVRTSSLLSATPKPSASFVFWIDETMWTWLVCTPRTFIRASPWP